MRNELEQSNGTGTMESFDPCSADNVVSQVMEKLATTKSLLITIAIANLLIALLFERSGWAAEASWIAVVAGSIAYCMITNVADGARAAIVFLKRLSTDTISEARHLQASAKKNCTALYGKIATDPTIGVGADEQDVLQFSIAIENVDSDHVIGAAWPCGTTVANMLKEKLRIGTRISVDGNFVGRILGNAPERCLRVEYFVSGLRILHD